MDPQDVATLFGLALVIGLPVVAVAVAVPALRERAAPLWQPLTAVVAIGATLGSLYFSERAGFIPCELCWWQRIAMYPLAVIGTIAAFRRDRAVVPYIIVAASIGLAISAYHVYIQAFPEESNLCEISNPCSAKWVEAFGWMTIPQMAGTSFILVILSGVATLLTTRAASAQHTEPDTSASDEVLAGTP